MSNVPFLDSNFKIETKIDNQDIRFYDVKEKPFRIYGIFYEDGRFRRLPEAVAKTVNQGVLWHHADTAGGRVRFKTDSRYIAIHAKMPKIDKMPHFALTGSAGFDLYITEDQTRYFKTFAPPFDICDGYESIIELETQGLREITINFPLYSNVSELYIGLSENATVLEPTPYKTEKPIVYYGSSITQGGCASRPGNAYESTVSRRIDANFINLGFSGSARGEDEIAEYIKTLDMSAFVYDYDHNAPSPEHLKATHEKMFKVIREAHTDIPIIMLARPRYYPTEDTYKRLEIIENTYNKAKSEGDDNVYMLTGKQLMALAENEGTVDDCHPNDLGFASMAKAVGDLLEKIL